MMHVRILLRACIVIYGDKGMYYCFCKEELESINNENPLYLQYIYSREINKCVLYSEKMNKFTSDNGAELYAGMVNESIIPRSSYDKMSLLINALNYSEFNSLENLNDLKQITAWYKMNFHNRKIVEINAEELFDNNTINVINGDGGLFVKTVNKGFSMICNADKLIEKRVEIEDTIFQMISHDDKLLVSKYCQIKNDSIGKVEARFFVFDNKIINSSRYTCTLRHRVPKVLKNGAEFFVDKIKNENFPSNYVLDIALFIDDECEFADIVEINPLSSSLCYLNNTVFFDIDESARDIACKYGFGYEYAFDYINNPNKYHLDRMSNVSYLISENNRFEIL